MVDEVLEDLRGALEAGGLQGVVLILGLQEGIRVVSQEELGRLESAERDKVDLKSKYSFT